MSNISYTEGKGFMMKTINVPNYIRNVSCTTLRKDTAYKRYCNNRLWYLHHPSLLLQVPWESPIGIGRRPNGGGVQPTEGAVEVGETVQGFGKGGHRCPDIGKKLRGGGPGGPAVWVGDVS